MQITEDRRALHRIPELDHQLPKTMAYLRRSLEGLRCELSEPIESSLCAWFDFGAEDAIAFRSDADALPISEKTGVDFASEHPGKMHACGHDGHMSMLLELARRLDKKDHMPHNVLLVFQPAEETTGGAHDICNTGIFEKRNVKAIFGLHLWPGIPAGVIASRNNEMMARSCEVWVDVYGKSSHIARPEEGIDALAAAVEFYSKVRALEATVPPHIFRLLNFGLFTSGTVSNAVSAHTRIEGSLRAFQDETFFYLHDGILRIAQEVEQAFGCTVKVNMNSGYPAVMNPDDLYQRAKKVVDFMDMEKPLMITEDFSWYQRTIPGMFFFLGLGDVPALHADTFNFDEEILLKGADFFEKMAEEFQ